MSVCSSTAHFLTGELHPSRTRQLSFERHTQNNTHNTHSTHDNEHPREASLRKACQGLTLAPRFAALTTAPQSCSWRDGRDSFPLRALAGRGARGVSSSSSSSSLPPSSHNRMDSTTKTTLPKTTATKADKELTNKGICQLLLDLEAENLPLVEIKFKRLCK